MNNRGSFWSSIPPVTKNLLIINFLLWFATIVFQRSGAIDLQAWLGLHYWRGSDFNAAQLITYMFMHDTGSFAHIFFNMFSLWMFGRIIEQVLGVKRFLFYYLSCGIGAAIVQELTWEFSWQSIFVPEFANLNGVTFDQVNQMIGAGQLDGYLNSFFNSMITVGASGAVFGILLAFGMLFPNMKMYIIPFPFPVKAKWMVLGYGVIELLFGVSGMMSGVAHFAHLGGMIFGFIMLWYWKRTGAIGGGHGYY